jgi:inner membrane transporter RhtA
VQVLLGIVSVQIGAALAKQLFADAGAAGTVTLRLFFAAVVLLLIWRPSLRLDRRTLPVVLAYGLVLGVMNLCFYQAILRIPLGIAVTIEFLGPLAVALGGSRRLRDGLWALMAAGGVVLLTEGRGELSTAGLLFALAAGICWGGYILLTAALGNRTTDGQGLAVAMTVAALVVMPVGVLESGTALLDPTILTIALAVALLSSVVPYSLELEALRNIPPKVFGVLMSMEPAVAALAGLLVLGEALHAPQWIAVGLVVLASAGATKYAVKPAEGPERR